MSKAILISATVLCSAPTGYRRAGLSLVNGKNELEVTHEQFLQLENDPRLTVAETGQKESAQRRLDSHGLDNDLNGSGLDSVELNLTDAPRELAPFIAAIHEMHQTAPLTKKPNVDELQLVAPGEGDEVSDDGELASIKPTASQRDAAWSWYQDNVVNNG